MEAQASEARSQTGGRETGAPTNVPPCAGLGLGVRHALGQVQRLAAVTGACWAMP